MTRSKGKALKRLIHLARRCSKRGRAKLIKGAPDWFIRSIMKTAALHRAGKVGKGKKTKQRLGRFCKDLNALAQYKTVNEARRRLVQRGGILPALVPLLIAAGKGIAAAAAGAAATGIAKSVINRVRKK